MERQRLRYPCSAAQAQKFVRGARRIERMLRAPGGSLVDPESAFASVVETIAQAEIPFWLTGELALAIPALPRPTLAALRELFPWIREENGIERDTSSEGAVTLTLSTILRPDEKRVNGEGYERRIAPHHNLLLGYQQAAWLVTHQVEFPAFMALLREVYIDFPGLVVVDLLGGRHVPFLNQDGVRWSLHWYRLGHGFGAYGRVASCKPARTAE